ncbi:MAG: Pseudouridine synthase [Limisphaerales bacterium]|nr:MAG: Pseudouridine synthase [Limisphaerales bacterium]KAG0508262.1 MAG: Pseudouridine synthase [Limisphaerales bacterium]TXT49577.1 MAG: Pseudouridine synthase [Limisphaerales bacterium]
MNPPCVLFEDEHLLVVNKPAGWNTHAPAPHAGEGIYDWLRHREPRWADLAIIHRLDKETSGVLVFGKTPLANKSLTEQFEQRKVSKRYLLVSDRPPPRGELVVRSNIARDGERYTSLPTGAGGEPAETRFKLGTQNSERGTWEVTAEPHTGRTHQIRVHAAANGFPILGDTLYGGTPAARVFLHAHEIRFQHPATGKPVIFDAPPSFTSDPRLALREALVGRGSCRAGGSRAGAVSDDLTVATAGSAGASPHLDAQTPPPTTAFRLVHGAADRWPGWQVERLGDFLLSQSEAALTDAQTAQLSAWLAQLHLRGAYHKHLDRRVRETKTAQVSPQLVLGEPAPERFTVLENGLQFELSFTEGYSYGLFLDQRDNRRRLLTGHVAAGFDCRSVFRAAGCVRENQASPDAVTQHATRNTLLNCFAYTCAFSVAAAQAGAHTTSLDLSKKYLEWGRRNFALNGLDAAAHDFLYGDVFDWLRRLAKKGRQFDAVLLDPPTFSQSKESGVFRAEKDYGKLVALALPLLKPDGVLFASTNCATLSPEEFLATIEAMVQRAGRRIVQQHYVPQPPDFPITRDEPAYLKTVWLRVS